MSQADDIRQYIKNSYISPARRRGQDIVIIRAGDVDREMGLGRVPNVN